MSKLGKMIVSGMWHAKRKQEERERLYAPLRDYRQRFDFQERFSAFDSLVGHNPGPDEDWRYQAGIDFFDVGQPPKMSAGDFLHWDDKMNEVELWEQKRDSFEKYMGVKYKKRRRGF
jgi:hypothetical protein